jgi:hypothetical protein
LPQDGNSDAHTGLRDQPGAADPRKQEPVFQRGQVLLLRDRNRPGKVVNVLANLPKRRPHIRRMLGQVPHDRERAQTPGQAKAKREGFVSRRPDALSEVKTHFCKANRLGRIVKPIRVQPLADAAETHPPLKVVDMSGKPFNTIFPTDYRFWELLNQVVQEEPSDSPDPVTLGFFRSIDIQKGKPFAPDERMQKILTEAAVVGTATARNILFHTRDKAAYYYPDSNWQLGFTGGYKFQAAPGVADFDAATFYYYLAILVTPAMEEEIVGKGSQYAFTARDANGNPLDGGKNYKLHLPPNVPVKDFWSAILYSDQTRSQLQTDQRFPSVSSQTEGLLVNADGSVDVYFGPKAPAGKENNWAQTVPGTGWNLVLRLYGALEPWFDQSWRPGEIELQP